MTHLQGRKAWLLAPPPGARPPPLAYEERPAVAPLGRGAGGGCGGGDGSGGGDGGCAPFGARRVEMRPGDVLYIPRGWAHEAQAATAAEGELDEGTCPTGGGGGGIPLPGAPHSLHLTWGLEVHPSSSWWGFMHLAVRSAAAAAAGKAAVGAPAAEGSAAAVSQSGFLDTGLPAAELLLHLLLEAAAGGGARAAALRASCPLVAGGAAFEAAALAAWRARHGPRGAAAEPAGPAAGGGLGDRDGLASGAAAAAAARAAVISALSRDLLAPLASAPAAPGGRQVCAPFASDAAAVARALAGALPRLPAAETWAGARAAPPGCGEGLAAQLDSLAALDGPCYPPGLALSAGGVARGARALRACARAGAAAASGGGSPEGRGAGAGGLRDAARGVDAIARELLGSDPGLSASAAAAAGAFREAARRRLESRRALRRASLALHCALE